MRYWLIGWFCSSLAFGEVPEVRLTEDWFTVQTQHFEILSNTDVKRVKQLAYDLETSRAMLAAMNSEHRALPGKPIRVILLRNLQSFLRWRGSLAKSGKNRFTKGLYRETPTAHYLVMQGFRLGGAIKKPTLELTLHEVVHLHHKANYRDMPLWLDEGLAEYYSRSEIRRRSVDVGFLQREHVYLLRNANVMPLDDLFETQHHSKNYQKVMHMGNFYSQAWAFIHFLKTDPEAVQQRMLQTYMGMLREGADNSQAADQIFNDREAMRRRFQVYTQQVEFRHENLAVQVPRQSKDYDVQKLPVADAHAWAAALFTGMSDYKYAKAHLDKAKALGASVLQLGKAEALLYSAQGQVQEAVAACDRVLAETGGRSAEAHFIKASLLSLGRATWDDASQHLEQAIRVKPDFAPAYSQLGLVKSFALDKSKSAEIEQLIAKGIELERGDHEHYLRLAQARVNLGNFDTAMVVARPLLKVHERRDVVRSAANLIRLIQSIESKTAKAEN